MKIILIIQRKLPFFLNNYLNKELSILQMGIVSISLINGKQSLAAILMNHLIMNCLGLAQNAQTLLYAQWMILVADLLLGMLHSLNLIKRIQYTLIKKSPALLFVTDMRMVPMNFLGLLYNPKEILHQSRF